MFLEIKDLSVKIENKNILKGLNLNINKVKCTQLWAQMDLVKVH